MDHGLNAVSDHMQYLCVFNPRRIQSPNAFDLQQIFVNNALNLHLHSIPNALTHWIYDRILSQREREGEGEGETNR